MPNLLIADSGSTKTAWRLISADKNIYQATTEGINPYYQEAKAIAQILDNQLTGTFKTDISEIFFYGAGCSTEKNRQILLEAIKQIYPNAKVAIAHDMLAAARALCGHEQGIACILGTGANTCLYDGSEIIFQPINIGFWLGDEGSGGYLGKKLLTDFLHQDMPQQLAEKLQKRYDLTLTNILEQAYQKSFPNRYFARFAKFVFDNIQTPYCYQLVYESFSLFLEKYVAKIPDYQQYKVHCVGSVGFYFSNILRQVANDKGVSLQNVLENPIAGLTLYHTSPSNFQSRQ